MNWPWRGSAGGSPRRVRTPGLLQMEAVECGAAALGIVLGYFGRFETLENLRVACGVSRDGSKASNVVRAAQGYGLAAAGYRKSAGELRAMSVPMIVFWEDDHFLVVEGFRGNKVYLNDPAQGARTLAFADFQSSYSGVVLTFEPGPGFRKGGEPFNIFKALARRYQGSSTGVWFALLAGLALVLPGLLLPTYNQIFVDQFLVNGFDYWVRPLLLAIAITALVRAVLVWYQQKALLRQEIKMSLAMSAQFFWHILRLPMVFFSQRYAGDIASRVGLNDRLAQLLSGTLANNVLALFSVVFFISIMAAYDVGLTALVVLVGLLNLAALKFVSHRRKDLNLMKIQEQGKLMGLSMSGLQIIETLKASGEESDFFARWAGGQAKYVEVSQRFGAYSFLLATVPPLLSAINAALVIGVGGLLIMDARMTMGMLMAYQSFMNAFISPLNGLVGLGGELQEIAGDTRRLDDVLHYPVRTTFDAECDPTDRDAGALPARLSGRVTLENVSFGYSRLEPPLIENFSLELEPGARVALVGASGSGKSTISRLICGLSEPWSGEIRFDGQRRDRLPRLLIAGSLALVDQSIMLFAGTARENIALWNARIGEEDVFRAGRDARIHDELMARPGGYLCRLDEGGSNFSGGQRQRLEIARALATNPTILVLDEATSALDPATEKEIDDNLRRRRCTCIIVAHRLSTIRDCDEIIVLERGKVVERGRHDALMALDGHYARLIHAQ